MTIQEAIDKVNRLKPNMQAEEMKIQWLSNLDGLIFNELLLNHEHDEDAEYNGYGEDTDRDTELLAPFPYDEVYVSWLMCQLDLQNMETDKYQNDRAMFNSQYSMLSDWWTRTYMPVQRTRQLML